MSAVNISGDASTPSGAASEIRTSYPSPVSMVHSPDFDQSILAPDQSGGADPRQQLRVASSVLQAAYRRIRQVRRSLVELDSRSSDTSNIGPDHSALLLSTSPVDEFSSDADDLQALRSNLAAMDRRSQEYLDRFAPGSGNDYQVQPPELPRPRRQIQLASPSSSSSAESPLPPRRSMLESHLARRREILDPDDAATFLGRRVAAREAAGPSRPVEQQQPQADPVLRAVEMERELIHLRSLNQQRRTDPGISMPVRPPDTNLRSARSLDIEALRAQRQQPSITTNLPTHARPRPHRWRTHRAPAESRQNSGNTQSPASANTHPDRDRLSILSNFSAVQNLATPTSAVAQNRPLLFEEPTSYTNTQRRDSRDIVESPVGDRSYFIHRRVNADGDELVHNINLEWDEEDPLSWLGPPRERESQDPSAFTRRMQHRFEALRAARVPPPVSEPRRRGWARLDADGNEIPSDEEEELERSRAEYRIQALYHARANPPPVFGARAERRAERGVDASAYSNLITRTSVSPDDYPTRETVSPRVRLNSRDAGGPRVGFGSVMDSIHNRPRHTHPAVVSDNSLQGAVYGSSVPFVVDPLPIPLSQMMPQKIERKGPSIRVSKGAGLAGR